MLMVEVFKTNVEHRKDANYLLDQIHKRFAEYKANFDLDDCDRILRIVSSNGTIQITVLIDLVKRFGFYAEILPDDQPVPKIGTAKELVTK